MRLNLSQATEDYLKVIYELTSRGQRASTLEVAERMDVRPASATNMLQKMADGDPPLVDYQKHHGVTLTPAGHSAALEVIRHHRLLEVFLTQNLGYGWDEVHAEADRLEHHISEDLEARIARVLGDPAFDPHGAPIPSASLQLPERPSLPLSDLRPGQSAVVVQVQDGNPELLRYLDQLGLHLQTRLTALSYSALDGNLQLQLVGQAAPVTLGLGVTEKVAVEVSG